MDRTDQPVGRELAAVDGVDSVSEEIPAGFDFKVDESEDGTYYESAYGLAVDPADYARTHRIDVPAGDLTDGRGEFATARVTGLTRAQAVRVTMWESLAVVAIGLLLGGLAAAATVAGVSAGIMDLIGISVVSLSWPMLVGLVLGAAAVVGVTTVATTWSATRMPPIRLVAVRE